MGRSLRLTLPTILTVVVSVLLFAAVRVPARAAQEFRLFRMQEGATVPVTELPVAAGVRNPVLGVLISLVDLDLLGRVSQSRLRRAAEEGGDDRTPWQPLLWVRRDEDETCGHPLITVRMLADTRMPIPYSVLGYNPGSVKASRVLRIDEWPRGDWSVRYPVGDTQARLEVEGLSLFAIREGELEIDVDGWLDWIMGGRLDDIRITGMALFRHEDHRYALAFGYNPEGKGHTGVLDLQKDEILFPPPVEFRALGRSLRAQAEYLQRRDTARRALEGS